MEDEQKTKSYPPSIAHATLYYPTFMPCRCGHTAQSSYDEATKEFTIRCAPCALYVAGQNVHLAVERLMDLMKAVDIAAAASIGAGCRPGMGGGEDVEARGIDKLDLGRIQEVIEDLRIKAECLDWIERQKETLSLQYDVVERWRALDIMGSLCYGVTLTECIQNTMKAE